MHKNQLPFFVIAISIVFALVLPTLIQDGMFMDGMLYTCVSKNLANGVGSFWFPVFSKFGFGGLATFHEHPPLVFAIQSLFFKLLGNGMYTERVYILFTLFITLFLITAIWKLINKNLPEIEVGWLPIILWIIIPVCFWSFSNNMQENTMGIFILLTVLFYLKYVDTKNILYVLFSSLFIFLATFCKGIPGFFPILMPFLYFICFKKQNVKQTIFQTSCLIAIPVFTYSILLCFPDPRQSLINYFVKRVLHRIGQDPTVESHFYIFGRIVLELILPIVLVIIVISVKRKLQVEKEKMALVVFFVLLGLAGVLPLALTKVQKGFYFLPSLPFFAIAFALIISKPVFEWSNKILNSGYKKKLTIGSVVFLMCIIVFSCFNIGKKSRDANMLHDVKEFGRVIPDFSVVSISDNRWNDWPLQCYLIRYHNISIDPKNRYNEYRILDKDAPDSTILNYTKLPLQTLQFDLYKKKN